VEKVFETPWFDIEKETLRSPKTHKGKTYYRLNCPNGVIIIAKTRDRKLILVRQFRPSLNRYTLELPAGFIDEGETPEFAASRELMEETGYLCSRMELIGSGNAMAERVNSRAFIVCGRNALREVGSRKEDGIKTLLVSRDRLEYLIANGKFDNLNALGSLFLAERRGFFDD